MARNDKLRLALLISGSGTTAEAIIKACQKGELEKVTPVAVIASRPNSPGIQKAKNLGVETFVVQRRDFPTITAFGEKLLEILRNLKVDLVSQNGWLPLTPANVVAEYNGRIINQHPGPLDPGRIDFGGKGMYGARVICARLAYEWAVGERDPWTESTIHWVNEEYDKGDLIRVVRMSIPPQGRAVKIAELRKNPQELIKITKIVQVSLLPLEHQNVIAALEALAKGEKPAFRRLKPLIPNNQTRIIYEAKKLAKELFPDG